MYAEKSLFSYKILEHSNLFSKSE